MNAAHAGSDRTNRIDMRLIVADAALRDRIQDATFPIWNEGLTRAAYGRWNEAQMRTAWGRDHLQRLALVDDGGAVLASMKRYRFDARYDGEVVRMAGIGAVFTAPDLRGRGYAPALIERVIADESAEGTPLATLFSEIGADYYQRTGFEAVPLEEVTLTVAHKAGAPAMLVRSGTDVDLPSLAAMHDLRAASSRFALVRTPDVIQYALARKRLLAGLGAAGRRQTEFFVAEEGLMAVAYVVITVDENGWLIEEAGDRDPAAARLGGMLQVLLAREPSGRKPAIRAWWPAAFPVPPQVTVAARRPSSDIFMVRRLRKGLRPLAPEDVFYWHADHF
jgi:predicted N-acetyltransferase YhbS